MPSLVCPDPDIRTLRTGHLDTRNQTSGHPESNVRTIESGYPDDKICKKVCSDISSCMSVEICSDIQAGVSTREIGILSCCDPPSMFIPNHCRNLSIRITFPAGNVQQEVSRRASGDILMYSTKPATRRESIGE